MAKLTMVDKVRFGIHFLSLGPRNWLVGRDGRKWIRLRYWPHCDRVGRWWPRAANDA